MAQAKCQYDVGGDHYEDCQICVLEMRDQFKRTKCPVRRLNEKVKKLELRLLELKKEK